MWRIPLPSSNYLRGLDQTVGNAMDSRKQMQQFMMQQKLREQEEQREQEQQPLKMDELRAKVKEQQTIANNKQKMIDADIDYKKRGGFGGGGVDAKNLDRFRYDLSKEHPDWSPEKIMDASNRYIDGETTFSTGEPLPPPSGGINYWTDTLNKKRNTAQGTNQQRFANTLETTFKSADENAGGAFKYAGVAGKFKQGFDSFTSQFGKADPDYLKFRKFVDENVPAMVTEIIRTGGANSTDSQKAIAFSQAITANIKTSPEIAKANYEELKKIYRSIGKTISKGITETRRDLKNQGTENKSNRKVWNPKTGMLE